MTDFIFAAVLFAFSLMLAVKFVAPVFRSVLDEIAADCPTMDSLRVKRELKRRARWTFPVDGCTPMNCRCGLYKNFKP